MANKDSSSGGQIKSCQPLSQRCCSSKEQAIGATRHVAPERTRQFPVRGFETRHRHLRQRSSPKLCPFRELAFRATTMPSAPDYFKNST